MKTHPQPGVVIETRARVILDMPEEDARALERLIRKAVKTGVPVPIPPFGLRFDRIEIID